MITTHSFVLGFRETDKSQVEKVGGKGANLGELTKIEGIRVPDGFCVTTDVFKKVIADASRIKVLLDNLSSMRAGDRAGISKLGNEIRTEIMSVSIPRDMEEEISRFLSRLNEKNAYAVRSSATAEDLPTASFAGQHDTYLNIIGKEAVLKHIRKCWASLFTDRAITYRMQQGFDHHKAYLSVIVQQMVFPQVAGILFTADPLSSNRKVSSIDASFGLGEVLVSGLVNPDNYKVRDGRIIDSSVAAKKRAVYALEDGGTEEQEIVADQQNKPALTDSQVLELEGMGRKIEAHFGYPQDIEWCLMDDTFYIVQSRPITTLFPIPEANDEDMHVYISVGHQQMMTDAMKPLGLSFFQLAVNRPFFNAGARLFVDVAADLISPTGRNTLINVLGKSDPLIRDALTNIIGRKGFLNLLPDEEAETDTNNSRKIASPAGFRTQVDGDTAIVEELIRSSEKSVEALKQNIRDKSGPELFEFLLEDIRLLKQRLFDPKSFGVIMAPMDAATWINEKMQEWLGEKNAADILSQSLSNNVTSEMGLALLDVADLIRPYPEIINFLQQTKSDNFLEELMVFNGGQKVRSAIEDYLSKYGMRCAGEIDITRTRWSERPLTLVPVILSNIKNIEPGASQQRFEKGKQEAINKEQELLERLRKLPDGEQKANETREMIRVIRNLGGYREYPKYNIVSTYFIYKQALLKEGERLVQANIIADKEDIYFLSFHELQEVVRTHQLDDQLIARRKDEYKSYEKLTPPRVMTSEGEIIRGKYKREHLPANAIIGLPVSSGIIEGRARVISSMEDADIEQGDILVTAFTDPSWTPLFVSIKGLVTEVGGLMTHGAVIAREYGLPAVVGVESATSLIKDGQQIRLNGTDGYIEIL
ncbi:phosphoenolpyruvate synthase [Chitinophaga pendula]|uniref:phosphoenolpyruvate synthase n=1 Tax=Chitinophaga TaxID=79328 RepID=UPI000BB03E4D|nr:MULTISPECIES: phosphoenolpyruvate synthase [Chitinophaga]ASZ13907.1 phosphoenolpyruvate synthase [Chitinophaga sp. MD30]UCJ08475.1 phosphoenolpyruvate synthase [Chitinophaga pendula]